MNRKLRSTAVAAATLAGLAFAGSAVASYAPRLAVSHTTAARGGVHPTTIHVTIPQSDAPTAAIAFYVPQGYAVQAAAPGTTIGRATASVFSRDLGLTLPLDGPVTVDDPAAHAADACSPGSHLAVWLLALTVAGQSVSIPVYVDPTEGGASAFGSYTITTCLPPPDVPAGTPGRSVLGAQLLDVDFTVSTLALPDGSATLAWRSLFTPYVAGRATPDLAGTVEARSFVRLPGAISLRARYLKKTDAYRLSGAVTEAGAGTVGASVQIYRARSIRGLAKASRTTTKGGGAYATAGHLRPRKTTYFQTSVAVAERDDPDGCAETLPPFAPAPPPCVGSTFGGFAARSPVIRIRP